MSGQFVTTEKREDGVMTIRLNRPDRNNAWSVPLENDYFAALDDATADANVRAVVLTGTGKAFCPGVDVQQLEEEAASGVIKFSGRRPMFSARLCPKPMVAAINGACAGVGLIQACLCDVRFVSSEARIATAFARRGLPAEYGMAWILPRLVGVQRASDLLLSARTFTGEEMAQIGLALRACPPGTVVEQAQEYAAMLAVWSSPRSMAEIRKQLWDGLDLSFDAAWAESIDASKRFATYPDFTEGVTSFKEKRAPNFPGLASVPGVRHVAGSDTTL